MRLLRKITIATGLVLAGTAALAVIASPASAHAVFVGAPSGYPINTDQQLMLNVPHELGDASYNVDVRIAMPSGWTAASCQTKPTWTCSVAVESGRQVVHFVKSGSSRVEDETFAFEAHTANSIGSFSFPTIQKYSTGEVAEWIGAAGTAEPAPILKTVAPGTPTVPTTPTTQPHSTPTPTPTVAPGPGETTPTSANSSSPSSSTPGIDPTAAGATTVVDPSQPTDSKADPGSTLPPTAGGATTGSAAPNGGRAAATDGSLSGSENADAELTSADGGSAAPIIAGIMVILILAAAGAALIVRQNRPSPN